MSKEIKNYGRSVKTKLLTLSKESGIPYMTILVSLGARLIKYYK